MTLEEALREVYTTTDEQDDLLPLDDDGEVQVALPGAVLIRGALRRGALCVSTWKFPDGMRMHFRDLEREAIVESRALTGDVVTHVEGTKVMNLEPSVAALDLVGALLTVTNEDGVTWSSIIVAQTGVGVRTLGTPDWGLELLPYTVTKAVWNFDGGDWNFEVTAPMVELAEMYDLESGSKLGTAAPGDALHSGRTLYGVPSLYSKHRNGVVFSNTIGDRAFRVRYLTYPETGIAASDELCSLPEAFHECVVQWARHWAFQRDGDFVAAQDAWAKLERFMHGLRSQLDLESDVVSTRMEYVE